MAKPRGYPKEPGTHRIEVEEAAELTRRFRRRSPRAVRAWLFTRDIFDDILAQKGCVGVRCYRAITPEGEPQLVLVGVDRNGDDIVRAGRPRAAARKKADVTPQGSKTLASSGTSGVVGDVAWPCPPVCSNNSPLNT